MLTGCYVVWPGLEDHAEPGRQGDRDVPLLGWTLSRLVVRLMSRQLRCNVALVRRLCQCAGADGQKRSWWRWPSRSAGASRADGRQWVLISDGCVTRGISARLLTEQIASSRAEAVLVRVHCQPRTCQEQLCLDQGGRATMIRRSWPAQSQDWLQQGDRPQMVLLRAGLLRSMLSQSHRADLDGLLAELREGGSVLREAVVAGSVYDLASDDLVRLQAEIAAGDRALLPRAVRRGRWRSRPGHNGVYVAESAVLRGCVALGKGAAVLPEAVVLGPCTVGQGAVIGRGAVLRNSIILPGARVADHQRVESSVVRGRAEPTDRESADGARRANGDGRPPGYVSQAGLVGAAGPEALGSLGLRLTKRAMDIALAGAVMLAPVLAVVAAAIKLTSAGPVFYVHRRQGRGGRQFGCIKFRTMCVDAEKLQSELRRQNEVDGPQFKLSHDPRVTPIGRFLRRTNIDEIPQFLNVLLGQMSLVGPRPSPEQENRLCPAWREARLAVRPGITGLWQICRSPQRDDSDFQQWIYYDVEYVRYQSIWLDLRILAKTCRIVACGLCPPLRRLLRSEPYPPRPWWRPADRSQSR
ncbi:MAG: sugar transferase [Phycisphaerae bacterium]